MNDYFNDCPLTLNTTRICADNTIDLAVEVSKTVFSTMKPNIVIIANKNEVFDAIAAASIIHHPFNASILFTDGKKLTKETLNELSRLSPEGIDGIQVILVGDISQRISLVLANYGYHAAQVAGSNHFETACLISTMRDYDNIIIISGEDYSEGIMAAYWSAHHGDPILYVEKNTIPSCTFDIINSKDEINIYILGSVNTVSNEIEDTLSKLPNVKNINRIDGHNPYDIAVNFSAYMDPNTGFGWGRNYVDGHAFTFSSLNGADTLSGALFAHMGKHTPLLLIDRNIVPQVVEDYIKSIKPKPPVDMPMPPFMHGYILGDINYIPYHTQMMIENALSID